MNKIVFAFVTCLAAASCAITPQQKAEKAVKKYILSEIDNPRSYEPVSFGTLNTVYTDYNDITDEKYAEYREARRDYENYLRYVREGLNILAEYSKAEAMENKKKMDRMQPYADSVEAAFVPEPKYMSIWHEFRSENRYGATVKESHFFRVSLDWSRVRPLF